MKFGQKIRTVIYCKKELLGDLKEYIILTAFRKKWREWNTHNGTYAVNKFPISKVQVGLGTYGGGKSSCL